MPGDKTVDNAQLYLDNLRSSPRGVDALLQHQATQTNLYLVWALPFLMKFAADMSGILSPAGCIQMGDQFLKVFGAVKVVPITPPWCIISDATLSGFALLVCWEVAEKTQQLWKQSGVMSTAVEALATEVNSTPEVGQGTREDETKGFDLIQQRHDQNALKLGENLQNDLKGLLAIRRREVVRPFKKYTSWPKAILRTFVNFAIIRISGDRSISKEQKQQRIDALDGIRQGGAAMKFREGFSEDDFFKPFEGSVQEFDTQINQMMESLWEYEVADRKKDDSGKIIEVPDPDISIEDIVNISKMIDREGDCPAMTKEQKDSLQKKCYTMLQMKTGDFKRRINIAQSRQRESGLRKGFDTVAKPVRSAGRGLMAQVSKFNPLPNQKPAGRAAFDLLNGNKDPTEKLSQYKTAYKENIESLNKDDQSWGAYSKKFAQPVTSTSERLTNQ